MRIWGATEVMGPDVLRLQYRHESRDSWCSWQRQLRDMGCGLVWWLSVCGPRTSSLPIPWELLRNATSQAPPHNCRAKNSR